MRYQSLLSTVKNAYNYSSLFTIYFSMWYFKNRKKKIGNVPLIFRYFRWQLISNMFKYLAFVDISAQGHVF